MLMGDFNGTMNNSESWNSRTDVGRSSSTFVDMRRCLKLLNLGDLDSSGPPFIWSRRRQGAMFSQARLDHAVTTLEWVKTFPNASIKNITDYTSDHTLILLDTSGVAYEGFNPFKYEELWAKDIHSHWVVKGAWQSVYHPNHGKCIIMQIGKSRVAL
ncbi:Endonuclease/exonuclease/phosphatase [Parasponia andersonii]|uniref:Endonuclease/exonuclease/phosphatase n=1 Tax=Parasponia andersonii TaxID=3476 RepID=A0A2P5A8H3_PARAD|nr:Endonuclease/exonuclease/phosphatase [Parasponia andersonii]